MRTSGVAVRPTDPALPAPTYIYIYREARSRGAASHPLTPRKFPSRFSAPARPPRSFGSPALPDLRPRDAATTQQPRPGSASPHREAASRDTPGPPGQADPTDGRDSHEEPRSLRSPTQINAGRSERCAQPPPGGPCRAAPAARRPAVHGALPGSP